MLQTCGMGQLQKNPFSRSDSRSLYSLGLGKTVLIVGLGNIGRAYQKTRHNIGFDCLDHLLNALEFDKPVLKKDLKASLAFGSLNDTKIILCKPTTLMNLSGEAVRAVSHFYKISPKDIAVVHDELDINFGQIRCRFGGSDGGHGGVKSIINILGPEFGRVRVGIGPKPENKLEGAAFVLSRFTLDEEKHMTDLKREVTAILTEFITTGELAHETRRFIF